MIEVDQAVKHSQEIRRLLSDMLSGYQDAETGQRGYLISGRDEYLTPYTEGLADIARIDRQLAELLRESPQQQGRLQELRTVGDDRLGILSDLIELRKKSGFGAAQDRLLQGQGLEAMRQVRTIIRQLDDSEARLLEERRKIAHRNARTAIHTMVYGSIFGSSLLALAGWFMVGGLSRQIGSAVQQIRSSSVELQSIAAQQASGAREQATSMTEISTTLSQLLSTSNQIAGTAEDVSKITEQVTEATQQGNHTVERGRQSVQSIQWQVGRIVDEMLHLKKKSGQIGSVTEMVSELAEQTNILAINATIEAVIPTQAA